MLLSELKQRIADYEEAFGEDADPVISVAVQPNYPMTAAFRGVVTGADLLQEDETLFSEPDMQGQEDSFWLAVGNNDGYTVPLHSALWDVAH
jgi:hypothetical protein